MKRTYSTDEAREIARTLEIDFSSSPFDLDQFRAGLDVEAEHGQVDATTNVTNDDPLTTGKIALAHLHEIADYYTRLQSMETGAKTQAAPGKSRRAAIPAAPMIAIAVAVAVVLLWRPLSRAFCQKTNVPK